MRKRFKNLDAHVHATTVVRKINVLYLVLLIYALLIIIIIIMMIFDWYVFTPTLKRMYIIVNYNLRYLFGLGSKCIEKMQEYNDMFYSNAEIPYSWQPLFFVHCRCLFHLKYPAGALTLNCIRGYHGTQHLVFRLSHFNAAIFLADNFCNCLNSSCASFGEKN